LPAECPYGATIKQLGISSSPKGYEGITSPIVKLRHFEKNKNILLKNKVFE